jgi:hypothetical protein
LVLEACFVVSLSLLRIHVAASPQYLARQKEVLFLFLLDEKHMALYINSFCCIFTRHFTIYEGLIALTGQATTSKFYRSALFSFY